VGLAIALGLLHGALNGIELAKARASGLSVTGVTTRGQIVTLPAPWARLVVRVAGSWIAAIGLLMLGWSIAKGLPPRVG
jgi:urease accessory protein